MREWPIHISTAKALKRKAAAVEESEARWTDDCTMRTPWRTQASVAVMG